MNCPYCGNPVNDQPIGLSKIGIYWKCVACRISCFDVWYRTFGHGDEESTLVPDYALIVRNESPEELL